jgi:hypothetical protein
MRSDTRIWKHRSAIRRLRAAGFVVEGDDISTPLLDVVINGSAPVHLFPLHHGTGLLLEVEMFFTPPLELRTFALRAPWLRGGGRWSRYDFDAEAYRLEAPGRVLCLAPHEVLNHRVGPLGRFSCTTLRGYLLAELKEVLDFSKAYPDATLRITDSRGLEHVFPTGPLRPGVLPLEPKCPPPVSAPAPPPRKSVFADTIDRIRKELDNS